MILKDHFRCLYMVNKCLLTIIDEFSHFPFAFPCRDMTSKNHHIIRCLSQLFSIFGMPDMIHTNRAAYFLAEEIKRFLFEKGIATSKTSRYHLEGNGQVEKLYGRWFKYLYTFVTWNYLVGKDGPTWCSPFY